MNDCWKLRLTSARKEMSLLFLMSGKRKLKLSPIAFQRSASIQNRYVGNLMFVIFNIYNFIFVTVIFCIISTGVN